jgi:hypothetical protein
VIELGVQEVGPHEENGRAILIVSSSVGPPEKEQPIEAGVWTISELLGEEMKAQDVLTAIQTAVDLTSGQFWVAEIKFHEATGLIIAQGHVQQMHTIDQVIKRLRDGMKGPTGPAMTDTPSVLGALEGLKSYNQQLMDKLANVESKVTQLQLEKATLNEEIARRDARIRELEKAAK